MGNICYAIFLNGHAYIRRIRIPYNAFNAPDSSRQEYMIATQTIDNYLGAKTHNSPSLDKHESLRNNNLSC